MRSCPDDRVAFATEPSAHEDVLDVAQAADFFRSAGTRNRPSGKAGGVMVSSPARMGVRPNLRRRILRTTPVPLPSGASSAAWAASASSGFSTVPGWASATASSVLFRSQAAAAPFHSSPSRGGSRSSRRPPPGSFLSSLPS